MNIPVSGLLSMCYHIVGYFLSRNICRRAKFKFRTIKICNIAIFEELHIAVHIQIIKNVIEIITFVVCIVIMFTKIFDYCLFYLKQIIMKIVMQQ